MPGNMTAETIPADKSCLELRHQLNDVGLALCDQVCELTNATGLLGNRIRSAPVVNPSLLNSLRDNRFGRVDPTLGPIRSSAQNVVSEHPTNEQHVETHHSPWFGLRVLVPTRRPLVAHELSDWNKRRRQQNRRNSGVDPG